MSTGDQYPPSPEQQPQYLPNPYQQQPQYPQQQPQYPTNPYQQPPQYPYPGQPTQGQPYPSQPMYGAPPAGQGGNSNRRLFIIIGSIVGVVVLACCALFGFAALANRAANSNLGSQSQSTATVSATATTGSSTTSSNQHHKVGDTVAASSSFTVTVNSGENQHWRRFLQARRGQYLRGSGCHHQEHLIQGARGLQSIAVQPQRLNWTTIQ